MTETIGAETRVYQLLLNAVKAFVTEKAAEDPPVVLRTAIPNVGFKPTTYPYLEVQDFPVNGSAPTLGPLKNISGVFQVTVIVQRNTGIIEVKELASQIMSRFETGQKFYDADLSVTIHQQANERPPIYETNEVRVPITIPYQTFRR